MTGQDIIEKVERNQLRRARDLRLDRALIWLCAVALLVLTPPWPNYSPWALLLIGSMALVNATLLVVLWRHAARRRQALELAEDWLNVARHRAQFGRAAMDEAKAGIIKFYGREAQARPRHHASR